MAIISREVVSECIQLTFPLFHQGALFQWFCYVLHYILGSLCDGRLSRSQDVFQMDDGLRVITDKVYLTFWIRWCVRGYCACLGYGVSLDREDIP